MSEPAQEQLKCNLWIKKPVVVEATQWFYFGDHPKVTEYTDMPNIRICKYCNRQMGTHGFIETLEGGHIVCHGDWIITGVQGEHYPCKPDIFEQTYEPAEPAPEQEAKPDRLAEAEELIDRLKTYGVVKGCVYVEDALSAIVQHLRERGE